MPAAGPGQTQPGTAPPAAEPEDRLHILAVLDAEGVLRLLTSSSFLLARLDTALPPSASVVSLPC